MLTILMYSYIKFPMKQNGKKAFGFILSQVFNSYTTYINNYLKEIDLSLSQARILFALAHLDNPSIDDISKITHIGKSSVTKSIKILEKKDFVVKEIDSNDNRKKVITVTNKGKNVQKQALKINLEIEEKISNKFGKNQLNDLKSSLIDLNEFLK